VNSRPAHTNTSASAKMPSRAMIRTKASARRGQVRPYVDFECCASRTPTMAPIMIVHTNRNRAISSVQIRRE